MVRPKLCDTAKTEAAAAREAELTPRRDVLRAVGLALHGSTWIALLAVDLGRVAERQVLRGTVAQWDSLHRGVPAWAWDALGLLAREGAANLRRRADDLDAAFPDTVPPSSEEPPQADDDDYDPFEGALEFPVRPVSTTRAVDEDEVDAILADLGSCPPPPPPAPVPARPTGWTSKASGFGWER